MAYVVKKRIFRDFRHEFPQLCAPTPTLVPLDFTQMKQVEVVNPVQELPTGWINLRTYVAPPERELDAHTLMYRCVRKMRARWEKWNREHDIFIDYDHYDDGLDHDEIMEEEESESSYAEDPEDVYSD